MDRDSKIYRRCSQTQPEIFPASAPDPHGIINLSYSQECLTQSGWPVIRVSVRDSVFSQSGFQSMFRCVRGERELINDKCVGDLWIIDRSLRLEVICKCSCCYCITWDLRLWRMRSGKQASNSWITKQQWQTGLNWNWIMKIMSWQLLYLTAI